MSLAGGAFMVHFVSGCTTERIVVVHDDAGNGTILPGETGGAGGVGGRGTGGVGGATGPSPIGKKCLQDSDCKSGLTCLTAGSDAFNPGGPAGGLCTIPCGTGDSGDPDADCTAIDKNAVTNPTLLVEVTSNPTEDYDRGEKFENYKSIPSLEEYVLVHQNERKLEVFSRRDGWTPRTAVAGESAEITAIDARLSVDELY